MRFQTNFRRSFLPVLASLSILVLGSLASASVFQNGKQVVISNVHVIDDDLYAWGEEFTMEGMINGDLAAGAMNAKIYGQVSKSVNVTGLDVLYAGRCVGAFRSFAWKQTIEGLVGGSAVLVGNSIELGKGAVIEHDLWAKGLNVRLDGLVKGKVMASAALVVITGQINGDVEIHGDHLTIRPPAVINGSLTYYSDNPPSIDSTGVTITGTVRHEHPDQSEKTGENDSTRAAIFRLSGMIAAFLLGTILLRFCRPYMESSFRQLNSRFATSLAAGLVLAGVIALSLIVLAMSGLAGLIGQALIASGGVASVFGSILTVFTILLLPISGFFGICGVITFYLGRVIIALLVGAYITRRWSPEHTLPGYLALLLGLIVISLLYAIPYAGIVVYFAVAIVGAGAIVLGVKRCREEMSRSQV